MKPSAPPSPRYRAGVYASLIAEAVFIALVAMVSLLRGMDPWTVTRGPAAFLIGPEAVQPPGFVANDVALGMLMHLILAVIVGLAYAILLPRLRLRPVAAGLITGGILYLLGFWLLPLAFPHWLAPFWLPPTGKLVEAAAHALYGIVFGLSYARLTRPV
jgi:hypothetical protein